MYRARHAREMSTPDRTVDVGVAKDAAPVGIEKTVRWLRDYGPAASGLVAPVALGLALEVSHTIIRWIAWPVAAVSYGAFAWTTFRHEPRISDLRTQVDRLKQQVERTKRQATEELNDLYDDLFALRDGFAYWLGTLLEFGTRRENTERITIYSYNGKGLFTPSVRYSPLPHFTKIRRHGYRDGEGIIAKAWHHGRAFANDYPDPNGDLNAYIARCAEDGIDPAVVRNIRMKSRLYYGWRVVGNTRREPLAVIIVESLDSARYTEEELDTVFERHADFISSVVEVLASRMPDATTPRARGL